MFHAAQKLCSTYMAILLLTLWLLTSLEFFSQYVLWQNNTSNTTSNFKFKKKNGAACCTFTQAVIGINNGPVSRSSWHNADAMVAGVVCTKRHSKGAEISIASTLLLDLPLSTSRWLNHLRSMWSTRVGYEHRIIRSACKHLVKTGIKNRTPINNTW